MKKLTLASTILACVGAAGVVATAISAARAGSKALKVLEEAEREKGEELTKVEKIKTLTPVYLPTAVIGLSTITCIFGASILNKRQQAAISSAYALVNNSYNRYRDKVEELYGEEAAEAVNAEVIRDIYDEYDEFMLEEGELLFFDFSTMSYFNSTMDKVISKVITDDGLECYTISTPYSLDTAFAMR